MRFFLFLSYDGTAYHGWQIQPNGKSVQEVLEQALSTLLRVPTAVVGAGRTDAGVHARCMVAHFDIAEELFAQLEGKAQSYGKEFGSWLTDKLNRLLPPDIAVQQVRRVRDDAHARFDACARTYRYYLTTAKDVFARGYSMRVFSDLDFGRMNEAAACFAEYSDFTSFSKMHTDARTNNCRITHAAWTRTDEHQWVFTITADRFLRNMVRAVVGTLVEVGRGQLSVPQFREVVEGKNRCLAGESVPAEGLFLERVDYPENVFVSDASATSDKKKE